MYGKCIINPISNRRTEFFMFKREKKPLFISKDIELTYKCWINIYNKIFHILHLSNPIITTLKYSEFSVNKNMLENISSVINTPGRMICYVQHERRRYTIQLILRIHEKKRKSNNGGILNLYHITIELSLLGLIYHF